MDNSRTKKSIRNTIVALVEQGIYTVMSFLCRTVFIYSLGKTYLGFSGLFSDILTLLSLRLRPCMVFINRCHSWVIRLR